MAFRKPDPSVSSVRDFDIRIAPQPIRTYQTVPRVIPPNMQTAIDLLKASVRNLQIQWSPFTSAPNRIYSLTDTLTGPSTAPPRSIATELLVRNLYLFNLSSNDISEIRFSRDFMTYHNGVRHLTIQQQVKGIDVFGGTVRINIDREGRVLNISGEPISGIQSIVNTDTAVLSDSEALNIAATEANITNISNTRVKGLVFFPLSMSEARLAWRVIVEDRDSINVYQTLVDAVNGSVLWRQNLTQYQHGLIYPSDSPDPDTPTGSSNCTPPPVPGAYPACAEARVDVPFDGGDFFSTTDDHYNWWNDSTGASDTTTTKSNNVHAKEDQDQDDDDTEGFPTVTASDFSFVVDLAQAPTVEDATVQNRSSAIVNAFYWINRIHDIYYSLGFDEAAGNFQSDNFGLGGTGGDPVQADVQDGANTCNSGFSSTHDDGDEVRMTMYLCNNSTPGRDAAFENLIIIHEYTHGLVKRLVEVGPYKSQSGGLQDGSCDFMGLAITSEPDDDLTLNYPRGQWYYNDVNGNRRQPYSTNQSVFTRTYADISVDDDPWPAGEIWCNTMWMARANLVWKHGFAVGGNTALQLAVDGMKNAPSRPDYLDMRDAILQADNTNNAGVNRCILWDAFARMGMGVSAQSTGDTDSNPVEDFTISADCTSDVGTSVNTDFGQVCVGDSEDRHIEISNTGVGDLIIRSISKLSGSSDIVVDPLPHPLIIIPSASQVVSARCTPTTCGAKTATFRIETNDPDQPQVDLTFTCVADSQPPILACPADVTIECDDSSDPAHTGYATATDTCSIPTVTYADAVASGACPQASMITRTWGATDGCGNTSTCRQVITVRDTEPPVISSPPPDITVECSAVPPPATITATDNCDPTPIINFTEIRVDGSCPSNYKLNRTWKARDHCGNITTHTQVVTVQDTTPPVIGNVTAIPSVLWPPNHKMVPIGVDVSVFDNCDPNPVCTIPSVTSNEPENGLGDGDTARDWQITGNLTLNLRAERSGKGSGRIYTINVRCADACGNSSTDNVSVTVPHSQSKK